MAELKWNITKSENFTYYRAPNFIIEIMMGGALNIRLYYDQRYIAMFKTLKKAKQVAQMIEEG